MLHASDKATHQVALGKHAFMAAAFACLLCAPLAHAKTDKTDDAEEVTEVALDPEKGAIEADSSFTVSFPNPMVAADAYSS